ncbi:MAG: hypothetical protein V2A58_13505 [Planctomycetota bacterium]
MWPLIVALLLPVAWAQEPAPAHEDSDLSSARENDYKLLLDAAAGCPCALALFSRLYCPDKPYEGQSFLAINNLEAQCKTVAAKTLTITKLKNGRVVIGQRTTQVGDTVSLVFEVAAVRRGETLQKQDADESENRQPTDTEVREHVLNVLWLNYQDQLNGTKPISTMETLGYLFLLAERDFLPPDVFERIRAESITEQESQIVHLAALILPDCIDQAVAFSNRCRDCNGTGLAVCADCQGKGRINDPCPLCQGEKSLACKRCNETRVIECPICDEWWGRYGTGRMICPRCNGSGQIRTIAVGSSQSAYKTCTQCNGTGNVQCTNCRGTGKVGCPTCNATGRIRCANCRGRGYVAKTCAACKGKGRAACAVCAGKGVIEKPESSETKDARARYLKAIFASISLSAEATGARTSPSRTRLREDANSPTTSVTLANAESDNEKVLRITNGTVTDQEHHAGERAFRFDYKAGQKNTMLVLWLAGVDISQASEVRLFVKTDNPSQDIKVIFQDVTGGHASPPIPLSLFSRGDIYSGDWTQIVLPISEITRTNWRPDNVELVSIGFDDASQTPDCSVFIDDIEIVLPK